MWFKPDKRSPEGGEIEAMVWEKEIKCDWGEQEIKQNREKQWKKGALHKWKGDKCLGWMWFGHHKEKYL